AAQEALGVAGARLHTVSLVAVAVVVAAGMLLLARWLLLRGRAERSVTWGCGYDAPSPRMQYSGTSFSSPFAGVLRVLLPQVSRTALPVGPFPTTGHVQTHHVDAVERRMFRVLGEGESSVARVSGWLREDDGPSFAAGLVFISAVVLLILGAG
ncbi:MAG: hypothetical protein AB2A00_10280, partial [Myxococcota bacterium]